VNPEQATDSSHEPEEATVILNFEITNPLREQGAFGLIWCLHFIVFSEIFVKICISSRCLFTTPI